jgi:HD-GYP domain-containing protein (c-di-GMP phosphodiesterase class II)
MTSDEAIAELCRNASLQFDPRVVRALSEVLAWDRAAESTEPAPVSS